MSTINYEKTDSSKRARQNSNSDSEDSSDAESSSDDNVTPPPAQKPPQKRYIKPASSKRAATAAPKTSRSNKRQKIAKESHNNTQFLVYSKNPVLTHLESKVMVDAEEKIEQIQNNNAEYNNHPLELNDKNDYFRSYIADGVSLKRVLSEQLPEEVLGFTTSVDQNTCLFEHTRTQDFTAGWGVEDSTEARKVQLNLMKLQIHGGSATYKNLMARQADFFSYINIQTDEMESASAERRPVMQYSSKVLSAVWCFYGLLGYLQNASTKYSSITPAVCSSQLKETDFLNLFALEMIRFYISQGEINIEANNKTAQLARAATGLICTHPHEASRTQSVVSNNITNCTKSAYICWCSDRINMLLYNWFNVVSLENPFPLFKNGSFVFGDSPYTDLKAYNIHYNLLCAMYAMIFGEQYDEIFIDSLSIPYDQSKDIDGYTRFMPNRIISSVLCNVTTTYQINRRDSDFFHERLKSSLALCHKIYDQAFVPHILHVYKINGDSMTPLKRSNILGVSKTGKSNSVSYLGITASDIQFCATKQKLTNITLPVNKRKNSASNVEITQRIKENTLTLQREVRALFDSFHSDKLKTQEWCSTTENVTNHSDIVEQQLSKASHSRPYMEYLLQCADISANMKLVPELKARNRKIGDTTNINTLLSKIPTNVLYLVSAARQALGSKAGPNEQLVGLNIEYFNNFKHLLIRQKKEHLLVCSSSDMVCTNRIHQFFYDENATENDISDEKYDECVNLVVEYIKKNSPFYNNDAVMADQEPIDIDFEYPYSAPFSGSSTSTTTTTTTTTTTASAAAVVSAHSNPAQTLNHGSGHNGAAAASDEEDQEFEEATPPAAVVSALLTQETNVRSNTQLPGPDALLNDSSEKSDRSKNQDREEEEKSDVGEFNQEDFS